VILNECYSVPRHIIEQIHGLYSDLRLTWDEVTQKVRAERRMTHARYLDPRVFKKPATFRMARDGFGFWLDFPPLEENYHKLLYTIGFMDTWKRGGAKEIARQLEADEEREKNEKRRSWKSDIHMMAVESFREMNTPRTGWNPREVKAE
jgi:hypothetical protein